MNSLLPAPLLRLREQVEEIVARDISPHAAETDRLARWPTHSFAALQKAGLMGLHVPRAAGGLEQGLSALAVVTEAIGQACASSAICYGMHCVGSAVIAAKATKHHTEKYLGPIARGEHITTLSLSEAGSGAQFYFPETSLVREADSFRVNGTKQFVTNAGYADSYVVSTTASTSHIELGEFSCLVVDKGSPGMEFLEPWDGLGMRGNAARGLRMNDVRAPVANLLGEEGDQIWYAFEVVAPYFLTAMAGTYLGVAQAALEETMRHVKSRKHTTSGETLATLPYLQMQIAEMWSRVQRTRQWIYHAAEMGDRGAPNALPLILGSKAEAAETAVWVANEAMTLCGGIAYRDNSELARLLRDARASHVMSPTTSMLRLWMGRSLLDKPLL
ncbi:MAG TPA: acyl-CoA dehydrogenase family protein [Opitutaceae bacterium]|nr:acyl-CoA dehydrogenase family protein [Opitutaceae bacterium]